MNHQIFVKAIRFFQNTTWSCPFFKVLWNCISKEEEWPAINFLTALASFGGSARAIHFFMEGDFLMEQLQPCILWRIFFIYLYLYRYLFWQENLQSSIVWVILSAVGTIIFLRIRSHPFSQRWCAFFWR